MRYIILVLSVVAAILQVRAQDITSPQRQNVIKLDLTSNWLYRNVLGISYERVTKPNQSFVVAAGYQEFPRASNLGDNVSVRDDRSRNGYKFGGEYRFYLKKEN